MMRGTSNRELRYGTPPDCPGLYIIKFASGGITRAAHAWKNNEIDLARVCDPINRILQILSSRTFHGPLRETGKNTPPGYELVLTATLGEMPYISPETTDKDEILFLANTASSWVAQCPALYVGITEEQGLSARLEQHRSSLENPYEENSMFGVRARTLGLAWEDFAIGWLAATNAQEVALLRTLEKHMHAILRPLLSIR